MKIVVKTGKAADKQLKAWGDEQIRNVKKQSSFERGVDRGFREVTKRIRAKKQYLKLNLDEH